MCRLLGVVTTHARPLIEAVPTELPLFTALSERHKDGWGIAWYPDGEGEDAATAGRGRPVVSGRSARPTVAKGVDTARASTAYGDATGRADGELILAHLRRASVGLPVQPENTHPFVAGQIAFAHNGQFDLPEGLRERILARGGRTPEGTTDSELFLSLITVHAAELEAERAGGATEAAGQDWSEVAGDAAGRDWGRAIQRAAAELTSLALELGTRVPESLNCLLIAPDALFAFSQYDMVQAPKDQPEEVYELRFRADAARVLVSSTGYAQDGFTTIPLGGAIRVDRQSLAVQELAPLEAALTV